MSNDDNFGRGMEFAIDGPRGRKSDDDRDNPNGLHFSGGYITNVDGKAIATPSTDEGWGLDVGTFDASKFVLQGIAAQLNKPFDHNGRVQMLMNGCRSTEKLIMVDKPVLRFNHVEGKIPLMSNMALDVRVADGMIAFRCYLGNNDLSRFLAIGVDNENINAVSIGFTSVAPKMFDEFAGVKNVTLHHEIRVNEISLLTGQPAIPGTYVSLVEVKDCNSLTVDMKSLAFQHAAASTVLGRKLKAAIKALGQ